MEWLGQLAAGLGVACTGMNLLTALLGCVLGLLVGVLPGITPVAATALLLPLALTLPPTTTLILLAALYCACPYGGAVQAILLNRPGESGSPLVHRDGHAMARQGRFGPALVAAGLSASVAGLVVMCVLAVAAPVLARWGQAFGATENLSLMLLTLVGAVVLASGNLIKGLAMAVMGLLLSLVGTEASYGLERFALDLPELKDGIGLVALATGVFVYGDVLSRLARRRSPRAAMPATVLVAAAASAPARLKHLLPSRLDVRDMAPAALRGGVLGAALGLLPGGGAVWAAIASRSVEKGIQPEPGEHAMGQGNIRGVAAPEAAHGAAMRSNFLPLLALGLPTNAVLALLLGAMQLQHLQPGPQALAEHPEVLWGLVASLGVGSLLLVLLQLPLLAVWSRLLALPYRWLAPVIVLLGTVGVYSLHHSVFDIWLLAGCGVLGYVLKLLELDAGPLLLGFILGPSMETHLQAALTLSGGDWSVFVTHPLSAALLLVTLFLLVLVLLPVVQMRREEAFLEDQN